MRVKDIKTGEVYLEGRGGRHGYWRARKIEVVEAGVENHVWRSYGERQTTQKKAEAELRRLQKDEKITAIGVKHWKISRSRPGALSKDKNEFYFWCEGLTKSHYAGGGRRYSVIRPLTNYQGDLVENVLPELLANTKIQMTWADWEVANAAEVEKSEKEAVERKEYRKRVEILSDRLGVLVGDPAASPRLTWGGRLNSPRLQLEFKDANHADVFLQLLEGKRK